MNTFKDLWANAYIAYLHFPVKEFINILLISYIYNL